jgi:hypothetical protein
LCSRKGGKKQKRLVSANSPDLNYNAPGTLKIFKSAESNTGIMNDSIGGKLIVSGQVEA